LSSKYFTFILYLRHKCLKKAACSIDIVFNVVLCAMNLLNVVEFKLQVAFNINFSVVERTNVCIICHPQRFYHCCTCIIGRSRLHARNLKLSRRWARYGWRCPYESNRKSWRDAKRKLNGVNGVQHTFLPSDREINDLYKTVPPFKHFSLLA